MAVYCASCGGQLYGAVNRCWHCRRSFARPPSQDGRPAVRRAPVIVAGLAQQTDTIVIGDDAKEIKPSDKPPKPSAAPAEEKISVGSPFSPGWTMPQVERGRPAPAADTLPSDPDADEPGKWCALLSAICGLGGLIGSGFFPIPILAAWAGLMLGGIGLKNHRLLASAGIALCCLLLYVQGWMLTSALYVNIFGVDPWTAIFGPSI